MPELNLVWVISHDQSLQQRLHEDLNVIQVDDTDDLKDKTPKPSIIIYDPDERAEEICQFDMATLRKLDVDLPILVLSKQQEEKFVRLMLASGADGYLLKSECDSRIHESLYDLVNQKTPLSPDIASILVKAFRPNLRAASNFNLKDREIELLQLLSEGLTKKDISEKYNRSIHTIDNHVRQIYSKMRVNNLGQAVGEAFRSGVIS